MAREQITRFGGREIKHTGDGVMATFVSASSAVASAVAMQRESRLYNEAHPESSFVINVGLNAGEPVSEDADVFVAECSCWTESCAAIHLTPSNILELRRTIFARTKFVLTHIGTGEAPRAIHDAGITIAEDLQTLTL